jgi:hypothetical protein
MSKFWFALICILLLGTACDDNGPEGGGTLPEHGQDLVTNYIIESKNDASGGRISYIKDVVSEVAGEKLWCINVRYVNSSGLLESPILVSQRGEEWRLDNNPQRPAYEAYGCNWPKTS